MIEVTTEDRARIEEMRAAGCEVMVLQHPDTGEYRTVCRDERNKQYRVISADGPDFAGIHALWQERTGRSRRGAGSSENRVVPGVGAQSGIG